MNQIAGVTVITILVLLSILHIYWAFGGRLGWEAAIPRVNGKPLFQPSPGITLLVASLLVLAATIVAAWLLWFGSTWGWALSWGSKGIAAVFLLRAIGDFRIAGLFKRVRGTEFAKWDSWLFTPLCIAIALLTMAAVIGPMR